MELADFSLRFRHPIPPTLVDGSPEVASIHLEGVAQVLGVVDRVLVGELASCFEILAALASLDVSEESGSLAADLGYRYWQAAPTDPF